MLAASLAFFEFVILLLVRCFQWLPTFIRIIKALYAHFLASRNIETLS